MLPVARQRCVHLDATDPLNALREQFVLREGVIHLDGHRLGAMPRPGRPGVVGEAGRVAGEDLAAIARELGARIGHLLGGSMGQVVVGDAGPVNRVQVLLAGAAIARARQAGRHRIVTVRASASQQELHAVQRVAQQLGLELVQADSVGELSFCMDERTAVVLLAHVNERTGRMHDMVRIGRQVHEAGALVVWNLAHSAGAVPLDLDAADADFAFGCGHAYLNGGPLASAFLWVHDRHLHAMERMDIRQLFPGFTGPEAEFAPSALPAAALAALQRGVATLLAAEALGGMVALRQKSLALSELLIARVDAVCSGHGLRLVSPCEGRLRGSHVSWTLPEGSHAVMQALRARGVIGDAREPGVLRFGLAPLYTRFADVWDAAEHLGQVLETECWKQPAMALPEAVT